MKIGVDYYPEQWDKSLWRRDAELMAKTGIKTVRLAEFAWSRLEPADGRFDFEWLDEVIEILMIPQNSKRFSNSEESTDPTVTVTERKA